ncbi:hypothetical protein AB0E69_33995 [Kribbella sp. NPDC026611]|uniref:hypothetical protein n=1 Tax=Kribbella sp. NPDC026611 TaxID=3154911 RepID=UPI0034078651
MAQRRDVMIGCDFVSFVLVVSMAVPGMPLAVVCAGMAGVALVGGPFRSARLALLPELLSGDAYIAGLAARAMINQTAQLVGFAAGGVLVGLASPYIALVADAMTFAASAVLLIRVSRRPVTQHRRHRFWSSSLHGARVIAGIPGLPALYALAMLAGFYIGPEGLAAEPAFGRSLRYPAAGRCLTPVRIRIAEPANVSASTASAGLAPIHATRAPPTAKPLICAACTVI